MALDLSSVDWGALVGTAANLYGASRQRGAVNDAAALAQNHPYSTTSPFGSTDFSNGQLTVSPSDSPFGSLAAALAQAGLQNYGATTQDPYGANPAAYTAAGDAFNQSLGGNQGQWEGLAGNAFSALGAMGADPQAAAQNRYDLLTAQAQPGLTRARNDLEDRLFARGQLGGTGGANQLEAFQNASNQADIGRQLAAQDFANTSQANLLNIANTASTGATGRATDRFNLASQLLGTADNRRNVAFGNALNAQGAYQNMFNPLLQFAQLGVNAGTGSPAAGQIAAGGANDYYNTLGTVAGQLTPVLGQGMSNAFQGLNRMWGHQGILTDQAVTPPNQPRLA